MKKMYFVMIVILSIFMLIDNHTCYATIVEDKDDYSVIGEQMPGPTPEPSPVPEPSPTPDSQPNHTETSGSKKKKQPQTSKKVEEQKEETVSENTVSENTVSENTVSENTVSENTVEPVMVKPPKPPKKEEPKEETIEETKEEPIKPVPVKEHKVLKIIATIIISYIIAMIIFVVVWIILFAPFLYFRNEDGIYKFSGFALLKTTDECHVVKLPNFIVNHQSSNDCKIVFKLRFSNRHQGEILEIHALGNIQQTTVSSSVLVTI